MTDPKRRRKTSSSPAIQTQPLFPPSLVIPQQPRVTEVKIEEAHEVVEEHKVSPEPLSARSVGSAASVTPLVRFFVLHPLVYQSLMPSLGTGTNHKGCPCRVFRKHSVQSRSKRSDGRNDDSAHRAQEHLPETAPKDAQGIHC